MARHTVEYDELNGYTVESNLASNGENHGFKGKKLSVLTVVGETPNVFYRVYNVSDRLHFDYANYGDALQAYNWI